MDSSLSWAFVEISPWILLQQLLSDTSGSRLQKIAATTFGLPGAASSACFLVYFKYISSNVKFDIIVKLHFMKGWVHPDTYKPEKAQSDKCFFLLFRWSSRRLILKLRVHLFGESAMGIALHRALDVAFSFYWLSSCRGKQIFLICKLQTWYALRST